MMGAYRYSISFNKIDSSLKLNDYTSLCDIMENSCLTWSNANVDYNAKITDKHIL